MFLIIFVTLKLIIYLIEIINTYLKDLFNNNIFSIYMTLPSKIYE